MFLTVFVNFMAFCHKVVDLLNTEKALCIFSHLFGMSWVYVVYNILNKKYHITPKPLQSI